MSSQITLILKSRDRDIGGLSVRRLLPYATHRMVGPFIFFDHIGPTEFPPGHGMDVRPHPHLNLATVTYVFEGQIRHRDSLGSDQIIKPGDINWMVAGRGIVHSERTPTEARTRGGRLHAIQCWVAYPDKYEEINPHFSHHPKETLPEFRIGEARLKLLLGSAFGYQSPVPVPMDIFYLQIELTKGATLEWPGAGRESAVHVVEGKVEISHETVDATAMAIGKLDTDLSIKALEDSQIMLLGGQALGPRFIFWNLVSSSQERLEEAKRDWARGPGHAASRFPKIPGDDQEFIPLPQESPPPKGTPL